MQLWCSLGLKSSEGFTAGGPASKVTPGSSLFGPARGALPNVVVSFPQMSGSKEKKRKPPSLIPRLLSPMLLLCLILLDVSLSPAYTHWRGLCKGINTRRQGSLGTILESSYQTLQFFSLWQDTRDSIIQLAVSIHNVV